MSSIRCHGLMSDAPRARARVLGAIWVSIATGLSVADGPSAPPRPPGEVCQLDSAEYAELARQLADGNAAAVLDRAREELASHPDCWAANRAQALALVALGRPDDATDLLSYWASRDRADRSRVEALIDLRRHTGEWDALPDLISRIDELPQVARTRMFRHLLDELYDANEPRLAERILGRLFAGASEDELASLRRALEAATRGDILATWAELPSLPSEESSLVLRRETLIALARRVASACVTASCACPVPGSDPTPSSPPRLISRVEPSYPDVARRERVEGSVMLMLAILPSGEPFVWASPRVADRRLLRAAAEAVAQWRFEPTRVADEAVTTNCTVRIDFRIH